MFSAGLGLLAATVPYERLSQHQITPYYERQIYKIIPYSMDDWGLTACGWHGMAQLYYKC